MTERISRRDFVRTSVLGGVAGLEALASKPKEVPTVPSIDTEHRCRFGVNYVPRKRWMYNWQDWDRQSVAEDMRAIADLDMDHVRVHCLWPFFQPGENFVSEERLERLVQMLDAADAAGLDVEVTVLNGWMSGFAFIPAWVAPLKAPQGGKPRNMFTHPEVIEAEKLLFRRLAETVGQHRRFLGFDIGNELEVLLRLPSLNSAATLQETDAWSAGLLDYCEEVSKGKFHVNGEDHCPWFSDSGFSRENLATSGHATAIHVYPYFTGALDMYGYSGVGTLHLVEYMTELAYAYQTDPSRLVWVEETGSGPEIPDSYSLDYAEHLVRNAVSTGKIWGITWWGSHDIDPNIRGFRSREYGLGLISQENKPKPLGRKFAALARSLRRAKPEESRSTAMVIPDRGLSPTCRPNDWTYGKPYMNLVAQGKRPAIVLESRANDEGYLRARGITELIPLAKVSQ